MNHFINNKLLNIKHKQLINKKVKEICKHLLLEHIVLNNYGHCLITKT